MTDIQWMLQKKKKKRWATDRNNIYATCVTDKELISE